MNDGIMAGAALRTLAGTFIRYRRGEVTDRTAYVEAVVIGRRLEQCARAAASAGEGKDFITVIVRGDDQDAPAPPGLDVDALEGDVVRRGMAGTISEATVRRELFILKTMRKALDQAETSAAGREVFIHG